MNLHSLTVTRQFKSQHLVITGQVQFDVAGWVTTFSIIRDCQPGGAGIAIDQCIALRKSRYLARA